MPQPHSYYLDQGDRNVRLRELLADCLQVTGYDAVSMQGYYGVNLMFSAAIWEDSAFGTAPSAGWLGAPYAVTWLPPGAHDASAVIAHEMGHTFGLGHSGFISTYCRHMQAARCAEYGDEWDIMGEPWLVPGGCATGTWGVWCGHLAAPNKVMLGWATPVVWSGTTQELTLVQAAQRSARCQDSVYKPRNVVFRRISCTRRVRRQYPIRSRGGAQSRGGSPQTTVDRYWAADRRYACHGYDPCAAFRPHHAFH